MKMKKQYRSTILIWVSIGIMLVLLSQINVDFEEDKKPKGLNLVY